MNKNLAMMILQMGLHTFVGTGLSPALCDYNERAAAIPTLARKKVIRRARMRFAQRAFQRATAIILPTRWAGLRPRRQRAGTEFGARWKPPHRDPCTR